MVTMAVDTFMRMQGVNGFYTHLSDRPMYNLHKRPMYQLASDYTDDCRLETQRQISICVNKKYDQYDVERREQLVREMDEEAKNDQIQQQRALLRAGINDIDDYLTLDELISKIYLRFKIEVPKSHARRAVKKYCQKCRETEYYPKYRFPLLANMVIDHYKVILFHEDEKVALEAKEKKQAQLEKQKRDSEKLRQQKYNTGLVNFDVLVSQYNQYIRFNKPIDPMEIDAGVSLESFFPRSGFTKEQLEKHNDLLFRSTSPGEFHKNDAWSTDVTVGFRLFQAIHINEGQSFTYNEFSGDVKAFCTKYRLNIKNVNQCLNGIELQHDGWIFRYIA